MVSANQWNLTYLTPLLQTVETVLMHTQIHIAHIALCYNILTNCTFHQRLTVVRNIFTFNVEYFRVVGHFLCLVLFAIISDFDFKSKKNTHFVQILLIFLSFITNDISNERRSYATQCN